MNVYIFFLYEYLLTVEYLGQKVSALTVLAGSASCPMKRLSDSYLTRGKRECVLPLAFVNGYHQSPQSKSGFLLISISLNEFINLKIFN